MRNVFLIAVVFLLSYSSNAQIDRTNFRAGINAGIVVGDLSEAYSLNLGLDVLYHWGISREIDLGVATGFNNIFGETRTINEAGVTLEADFDNLQYIPLAASLRIYPTSGFKLGGDIGYAVGVSDSSNGGLYYRPTIAVEMNQTTEINVSYAVISDDVEIASVLVGLLFLF